MAKGRGVGGGGYGGPTIRYTASQLATKFFKILYTVKGRDCWYASNFDF
jgi:hypothetical protein